MKKLFYSFAMLALLAGCSDDTTTDDGNEPEPEPTPTEEVFTATLENSTSAFEWSAGDAISIFRSLANEKWAYDTEAEGFKKADNTAETKKLNYVFGIYPYDEDINEANASNEITVKIAETQNYIEGSFDTEKAPMFAVANKDSKELEFKNLCGFISVKIYGSATIKEIAIEGANGEKVAGIASATITPDNISAVTLENTAAKQVKMTLGEGMDLNATEEKATTFTLFVAPQTFSKGLSVIAIDADNQKYRTAFNQEIKVERNKTTILPKNIEIISGVTARVILDVKFNEDGTATDEGIFGLDIETIKTADGKTPRLKVYSHPEFPLNNIASFSHVACNGNLATTAHSFYYLDFSNEEEFKTAMADGFTMEVVTLTPTTNWDWWVKAVSTETFGIFRKGDKNNSEWCYGFNHGGDWFPGSHFSTETTAEIGKYTHSAFVYDFNNQVVQAYINGEWMAERPGISTFDIGTRFAIGGFPTADKKLSTQWNGEVALVRIYDQPLTEEDIVNSYYELDLPEASAIIAEPISEPLLDFKWNADDKSATNAGTQTSLQIDSYPNDITSIINVDGFGNIVNFNQPISNSDFTDGFYRIEYGNDADFKSKLRDGFTMELVCFANVNPGDYYVRPLSADTWGCMLWCPHKAPSHCWRPFANGDNNSYGDQGQNINGYEVFNVADGKVMTSFAHLVYVYNAEAKDWGMYVDGKFCGGFPNTTFNVGSILNINGMPYDKPENPEKPIKAIHGWNGKVAITRIYDEPFSQEQILARYAELQPTIQTLNTAIN